MERSASVSNVILKARKSISFVSLRPLALSRGRPNGRRAALVVPQPSCGTIQLRRLQHRSFASVLPDRHNGEASPESVKEIAEVRSGEKMLRIRWEDGSKSEYLHLWLRDHCRCKECFHQDTKQRLLDTFSISPDIKPVQAKIRKGCLVIEWTDGSHRSSYDTEWLRRNNCCPDMPGKANGDGQMHFWGSEIQNEPPNIAYNDIMDSDAGVKEWTSLIRRYGFSYIDNCPPNPSATEALLKRIAFIRPTHYGSFWDFTSDLSSADTAYTTLALAAHTDTTYFTDPCGLQLFHLLSHTDGSGGASLLVDAFNAAATLKLEAPAAYEVLSTVTVPAHASGNEGVSIRPARAFPVLNHDPETGRLVQVRWNNDDRGTLCGDQGRIGDWYLAARIWVDILRRERTEYWEQLRPGRPLIFDNWRVLHGRSAFTGQRRMCGGYINHDDFISRYRMTNLGRDDVLKDI